MSGDGMRARCVLPVLLVLTAMAGCGGGTMARPLWSVPMQRSGDAHTVAVDGILYVGAGGTVKALRAGSGTTVWITPVTNAVGSPAIRVTPGKAVFASTMHNTYALDPTHGRILWTWTGPGSDYVSRPSTEGGLVYVSITQNADHVATVYALDSTTGAVRWARDTGGYYTSEVAVAGGRVYVRSADRGMLALDAASGETVWSTPTTGESSSPPVVAGGTVYFSTDDYRVWALDARTGAVRWTASDSTGTTPAGRDDPEAMALAEGTLYLVSNDRHLYALRAADGSMRWRAAIGQPYGGPAVADGTVYQGGVDTEERGTLYALNAHTGVVLSSVTEGRGMEVQVVDRAAVYVAWYDEQFEAYSASSLRPGGG